VRIAVVGSGVSGLAVAWLLSREHEVHLLERASRLGGHTQTLDLPAGDGTTVPVDTGFIVYNEATYPLLVRLFEELGVATHASDMSWSLRCDRCDLEYAGSVRGLAAQPRNLLSPSYLRMVADIARFNRLGRELLASGRAAEVPIGRFLAESGFSHGFSAHYLVPMAAAIWSSGTGPIGSFPLASLLTFLDNHGLLGVRSHLAWRTVTGGARSYVERIAGLLGDRVHLGAEVVRLERAEDAVTVRLADGSATSFDEVVVATHADEALALLDDPSDDERELLGAWTYSRNERYVHADAALLPRSRAAWASWNYLLEDCRTTSDRASLTYDLNRLQGHPRPPHHLVTLNPARPPRADSVHLHDVVTHPGYDAASVATQSRLDDLSGRRRTHFVGAYQRWGFHEDGLWSAVRVAERLGVRWPA
jgi:predicted NAD/FAD-binding protein